MKLIARLFPGLLIIFFVTTISAQVSTDLVAKIDRYLNRAVENGYSGSVLIASNGKILLTKGYGLADSEKKLAFTADTVFDIGSITKQFTAAAILKLEMQGKLSVNDPITKFFESVPEDKKSITLHQLLTHSAGLTDSLGPDEEWIGRDEYLKKVLNSKLIHPPGRYAYSNVGYSLLAAVVEKVSGQEYERYLAEQILRPTGMTQTGYVLPSWDKTKIAIGYRNDVRWGTTYDQSNYGKGVTWHLRGNGGIHSTTGDLYRWSRALRTDQVLSAAARQKYFAPHVSEGDRSSYAYGWSVSKNQRSETVIAHNGGNGFFMATFAMIPQKDFVAILSTNRNPKNTDVIARRIDKMFFENLEELPEAFRQKYAGVYFMPSGVSVPVSFNENDEAVLLLNDPESWRLLGGTDSEDTSRAKQFDEKSRELMRGLLGLDFARIATVAVMDQKTVEADFPGFLKQIEAENGKCKDFDLLGSVQRRNGEYHLTPVRFKCEKGDLVKLIIWHENRLSGFRDLPRGNEKNFDHTKGNVFFSESNNRTIAFDERDAKPVVIVKTAAKEVVARKR